MELSLYALRYYPHISLEEVTLFRLINIAAQNELSTHQILTYSVALVRKRTIPTERPPLVDEVSANFCG
jgi:hypothetical protein